jgi:hypothetical protein
MLLLNLFRLLLIYCGCELTLTVRVAKYIHSIVTLPFVVVVMLPCCGAWAVVRAFFEPFKSRQQHDCNTKSKVNIEHTVLLNSKTQSKHNIPSPSYIFYDYRGPLHCGVMVIVRDLFGDLYGDLYVSCEVFFDSCIACLLMRGAGG